MACRLKIQETNVPRNKRDEKLKYKASSPKPCSIKQYKEMLHT